jgi:hypothetical protein
MTRILSFTLFAAAALTADPIATGSWNLTGDVQGYPVTESCVLTQTDAALSGTCTDYQGTFSGTKVAPKQ